jgi:DNA-binding CsgD family transcriptional regulator
MVRQPAGSGAAALLERGDELARIDELIAASVEGEGHVLVIEGRSGVGKSALLAELRSRAGEAGMAVCSARGSELEGEFAFGVVRQLFEATVRTRGKAEPGSGLFEGAAALAAPVLGFPGPEKSGGQFAALHGLYWLAANLAGRAPLLLTLDDAHWADVPSLRWLGYLQTRLEGLPILVALTTRPAASAAQPEPLGAVVAGPGADLLELGPLREASVAIMLRQALGEEPDPRFTAACHRATAGNPLALRSVMRDLVARGARPTEAGAAGLDRLAPTTIARRVLAQLARLGEPAGRLCGALAVIGDGAGLRQVAALAQLDPAAASGLADDLAAADLLAPDRPLRFVHPLLRAAVYDDVPPGARSRLHGRAAGLLASEGADAELIAAHLLRCDPGTAPDAAGRLRAAAPLALARGVPEAAIAYLRRALQDAAPGPARGSVLAELGRAEVLARDPAAADHLREALDGWPDPAGRARIHCDLADAALQDGRELLSLDWLRRALAELGDRHPETSARIEALAASIAAHNARLLPHVPDPIPRLQALARSGGPAARPASLTLAFLLARLDQDCQEVRPSVQRGLDGGSLLAAETADSFLVGFAAYALIFADELDAAMALAGDVLADAARRGSVLGTASGAATRAFAGLRAGRLAEAEADGLTALELARQHGLAHLLPYATAYLAGILLDRGRREEAERLVDEASLPEQLAGSPAEMVLLEARGRVRCAGGRTEAGAADLRASGEVAESLRIRNPNVSPWRSALAIALAPTAKEEACSLALAELELARRTGIPRAIGVSLRAAAAAQGGAVAVDLLDQAVDVLSGSPGVLDLARALLDRGTALRRLGHLIDAREPLRQALEIAARCGAAPLGERAREEALLAGARPRRARLLGVHALTPAELRVARLAAEGRSNRDIAQALFITANTVKDHLGHCYAKLGISSRGELGAALFQSGGSAGDPA